MGKRVAWNTIGTIFYCFCQWLITIVVVRIASYEAAGYLSLAMTTSSTFSAITLYSMRNYQISDVNGEFKSSEYVSSRLLTCIVSTVLCASISVAIYSSYQTICITAFMFVRVAEGLVDVLHGIDQKYDRYDLIGISYILRGVITIVTFYVVLMHTRNLIWTLIVMAICNLLVAFFWDWEKTSHLEEIKTILLNARTRKLLMVCTPIVMFTFLLSGENLFAKMMLNSMLGTDQLGIYSSIASPTLVVQVLASVVFNPFLPDLAELYVNRKYESFLGGLRKVYLALISLSIVSCICAMLIGRWGLSLLFGSEILYYYNLFMPIVWCTILTAFIWVLYSILVAMRQIRLLVIGMIIDFAILLMITRPCIVEFDKNGASIAQIIAYGIFIFFLIIACELTVKNSQKKQRDIKYD